MDNLTYEIFFGRPIPEWLKLGSVYPILPLTAEGLTFASIIRTRAETHLVHSRVCVTERDLYQSPFSVEMPGSCLDNLERLSYMVRNGVQSHHALTMEAYIIEWVRYAPDEMRKLFRFYSIVYVTDRDGAIQPELHARVAPRIAGETPWLDSLREFPFLKSEPASLVVTRILQTLE